MQAELTLAVDELYDFKQLEEIASGNNDFIKSLAQIYLNTIPDCSTQLVNAAGNGDWLNASKLAHKLKSTIDSLNMTSIQSDVRIIEMDAKSKKNTAAIYSLAVKVDEVIHLVAEDIKVKFGF